MSAIAGVRLAWSALLLCSPGTVRRVVGEKRPDRKWAVGARVLGARHLVQAWLERGSRRDRIELGAGVDALHAVSAFGFGLCASRRRRLAFLDAGVAGSFALWGLERSHGH